MRVLIAHIPVVVLAQDSPRAQALRSTPLQAKVRCGGKEVTLGTFATAEEAALSIARSPEGQLAAERAAGCSGGAGSSCTAADEPEQEQQLETRRAMLAGRKRWGAEACARGLVAAAAAAPGDECDNCAMTAPAFN